MKSWIPLIDIQTCVWGGGGVGGLVEIWMRLGRNETGNVGG